MKTSTIVKSKTTKKDPPALTPEAKESRIVAKAMDMAEEMIDNRTASSQILVHFLKLGTVRAELELEELRHKTALTKAKTDEIESNKQNKQFYEEVMKHMKMYTGVDEDDDYDEYGY